MIIKEKIKLLLLIIIPSLIIILIGILEIKYPDAMKGFDDSYTGRDFAGFLLLIIELFLLITWGKIAGIMTIIFTLLIMSICIMTIIKDSDLESTENNQLLNKSLTAKGITIVQHNLKNIKK